MLRNTFCHIPSISMRTEGQLWRAGIESWGQCRELPDGVIEPHRRRLLAEALPRSEEAALAGDLRFFADGLPAGEQWRLFAEYRRRAVYLDIETTGMGSPTDHITTIVTYDGTSLRHFIYGQNLQEFPEYFRTVDLLVTYNGKCFDVPFIQRQFGISMSPVHLDLRYILKSVGITGGLKRCEQQLGMDRGDLHDVDGFFAVLLWQEYTRRSNPSALETLLSYNTLDVINLEPLMVTAFNRKLEHTPFRDRHLLAQGTSPENPFAADASLIERLRSSSMFVRW